MSLILLTGCAGSQPRGSASEPAASGSAMEPADREATRMERVDSVLAARAPRGPLLRDFLAEMPKGADLHTHLSGAVYAETYLEWAEEQDLCAQMDPGRLVSCDAADALPMEAVFARSDRTDHLIDALSIRNLDVKGVTGREQFFATFARFYPVYDDRPLRAGDALAELLQRAAAQNVHHVEVILYDGRGRVDAIADSVPYTDDWTALRKTLLDAGVREAVRDGKRFMDRMEARADSLLGCEAVPAPPACRVSRLYRSHTVRTLDAVTVFARLLYGIERAHDDPRMRAVDLVAPEDDRVALQNYDRHLRMLRTLRRAAGPDAAGDSVRVGLHAGELTLGLVPPEHLRDHVWKAVQIAEADRLGHAVDVGYERNTEALLATLREREIAVEVCLTSNDVILGVTGEDHPLPTYLDAGVPVTLATDDEGVSRIDLTHEYVRAVRTYGLDYPTLKRISRNGLHYAFLPGQSLWQTSAYDAYVDACRGADPAAGAPDDACRTHLDGNPRAAAEWRLETAFEAFEASVLDEP